MHLMSVRAHSQDMNSLQIIYKYDLYIVPSISLHNQHLLSPLLRCYRPEILILLFHRWKNNPLYKYLLLAPKCFPIFPVMPSIKGGFWMAFGIQR
jgi:hypothetical protein